MTILVVSLGTSLAFITYRFSAFLRYQTAAEINPYTDAEALEEHLRLAIERHQNRAEYQFALGRRLFRNALNGEPDEGKLREAEQWLKYAVNNDPTNPEYYYELGRLSILRRECLDAEHECGTPRYFRAALRNAPKHLFLRRQIGEWWFTYNRGTAITLMRQLLCADADSTKLVYPADLISFFYEHQMDYEMDVVLDWFSDAASACGPTGTRNTEVFPERLEIRQDDGNAEWWVGLASPTDRVKKTLCLPERIETFNRAFLNIFMQRGTDRRFTIQIAVDDHILTLNSTSIARSPGWRAIPIEMAWLQGKEYIRIYVRAQGLHSPETALYIGGDENTQNYYSVFQRNAHDDLSLEADIQQGEYMIRLILEK